MCVWSQHPQVGRCLHNLAIGYGQFRDDQERKEELLEEALAIKRNHYGDNHWEVASTLANLVRILLSTSMDLFLPCCVRNGHIPGC